MADQHAGTRIREQVRTHYAAAATAVTVGTGTACCPGAGTSCCATHLAERAGARCGPLHRRRARPAAPDVVAASLGCGNPVAVADLHARRDGADLGSAAASTCCCRRAGSARPARPTGWT